LAVSAREKELQHVCGKLVYSGLVRSCANRVSVWVGLDYVRAGKPQISGGCDKASAAVAEHIEIVPPGYDRFRVVGGRWGVAQGIVERFDQEVAARAQKRLNRRVQVKHGDDGSRGGKAKLYVKLRANKQGRNSYMDVKWLNHP